MRTPARLALGFVVAGAGAAAISLAAGPSAQAAPQVCPALPGQSSTMANCSADSGRTGLSLAVVDNGGTASVTADNYAGPAAIAMGKGAEITMVGDKPGLSIAFAGPGAKVSIGGGKPATCSGGQAFAGDLLTLTGCTS